MHIYMQIYKYSTVYVITYFKNLSSTSQNRSLQIFSSQNVKIFINLERDGNTCGWTREEEITQIRQKRRQRSSLLRSNNDLKKSFRKNIHFWRVVVWCGVSQKIINFSKASILPSVLSGILPFRQIILGLNLRCGMDLNEFHPPNSNDDLCLLFCLFLLTLIRPTTGISSPITDILTLTVGGHL